MDLVAPASSTARYLCSATLNSLTSGTTGLPKGAVLRHRAITNNARFFAEILQAGPGDVWVNPMPLFHTAGCVQLTLGPVQGLFTQVLPPGCTPATWAPWMSAATAASKAASRR